VSFLFSEFLINTKFQFVCTSCIQWIISYAYQRSRVADQGFGNIVVVNMVVAQPCGNTTQNIKTIVTLNVKM
jgi:hypothetical protein